MYDSQGPHKRSFGELNEALEVQCLKTEKGKLWDRRALIDVITVGVILGQGTDILLISSHTLTFPALWGTLPCRYGCSPTP